MAFIATIFIGCDSILKKYPQTDISSGTFWKTESDFKLAANALYNSVSNNHNEALDLQSDDYYGRSVNSISAGTYVAPNTDGVWTNAYSTIRKANDLIEHSRTKNVSRSLTTRFEAEARFFRAYQYAELIKRFGDIPLVVNTLDMSSEQLYADRNSRAEVLDTIIADLKFAANNLPHRQDLSGADKGRITRGVALGLLSRVALYEGTLRKYHNTGSWNELLQISKDAAALVIQEKEFSLFPDFLKQFMEENDGNDETMLCQFYQETVTGYSPRARGIILDAEIVPTKNLADAFLCNDGLPIEYSPLFKGYDDINTEFMNRDPRMAHTIWEPLTPFENNVPLIPALFRAKTGYWPKKPGDITALYKTFCYTDYKLMRYAEVLLNYAEATYELNESISDEDLNISINELRKRVDMPFLTNAFINEQNGEGYDLNMRDEIRRERRVELAGEGYRYDDLIRWKLAETLLPNEIKGAKFQNSYYPEIVVGKDVILDEEGFIIVESSKSRSFDPKKNYLFPIPLRELSLNKNMKQNPGWD